MPFWKRKLNLPGRRNPAPCAAPPRREAVLRLLPLLPALLAAPPAGAAEAGSTLEIVRFAVTGGARVAGAPQRVLEVSIGQPAAPPLLRGRQFRLAAGFLPAREVAGFRDGFESGDLSAWSLWFPALGDAAGPSPEDEAIPDREIEEERR